MADDFCLHEYLFSEGLNIFLSLEIDKQQIKQGKDFYKLNTSLLLEI
jgi:hypothetical protein